jgi:hypothetical protein
MSEALVRQAFLDQAVICTAAGAPFTGWLCRLVGERLTGEGEIARRVLNWTGVPSHQGDALPLRLMGGLHALARSGRDEAWRALYPPEAAPGDDEAVWAKMAPAQRDAAFGRYMEFTTNLKKAGQFVDGAPLQQVKTAKTVRIDGGKRVVADGPFAETREQLGGYYRAWAKNLDDAITIAAKIPSVEFGTIEVRPVMDTSTYT